MKHILIASLLVLVLVSPISAQESYTYTMPDVREDFCGIEINYQYCKCAFHGDYCDAIGTDQSGASWQVMGQFRSWVGDQIEAMARSCLNGGNHWNAGSRTCTYKEERDNVRERAQQQSISLQEEYSLPDMTGVPEPVKEGYYGKISNAEGEVFVYQWAFKRWVKAQPGLALYQGDFIKTYDGSTRIIYNGEFGEDVLNLSPEGTLETGRYVRQEPREDPPSLLGIIQEGAVELYNEIQEEREREAPIPMWYRQLHSPKLAPGIRGSHVIIAYNSETQETLMAVNEGVIEVMPPGSTSTVTLVPGDQAIASDNSFATSSIENWSNITSAYGLPPKRVDATPEELNHIAPETPVDDQPDDPEPTREELVGDLSDIEEQFNSGGQWGLVVLVIVIGGVGYWFYRRKKVNH